MTPLALSAAKSVAVQAIEELGGQVLTFSADVADREQMRRVMKSAEARSAQFMVSFMLPGIPAVVLSN